VRGRARVIQTLAEAAKLQVGDILVAREYGLPAVVGTGTATSVIRDGPLLEVEGGWVSCAFWSKAITRLAINYQVR
jgi:hypothetical protein